MAAATKGRAHPSIYCALNCPGCFGKTYTIDFEKGMRGKKKYSDLGNFSDSGN